MTPTEALVEILAIVTIGDPMDPMTDKILNLCEAGLTNSDYLERINRLLRRNKSLIKVKRRKKK